MSRKIFTIIFIVPLLIFSCKKEQVDSKSGPIPIIVSGQDISALTGQTAMNFDPAEPVLKTAFAQGASGGALVSWIAPNDEIGVYAENSDVSAAVEYAKNVKYVAQASQVKSTFLGSPANITLTGTAPHKMFAYYPYNSENNGVSYSAVKVRLPTPQSQSLNTTTHLGTYDYEIAKSTANPITGVVNFTFSHLFSIVRFSFTGATGNTDSYISKITLTYTPTGANPTLPLNLSSPSTIDLSGTIPSSYASATGTPSTILNITGGTIPKIGLHILKKATQDAYMLVLPNAYTGSGSMKISTIVKDNSGGIVTYADVLKNGTTFLPGVIYTVTMPDVP